MDKQKVLFVCIHNSARSQMAEAFLNSLGGNRFIPESAGLEPGTLNSTVVEVMMEAGVDISSNKTKGVDHFLDQKKEFSYVITVCDEASAERCPHFPGTAKKEHWSFPDPSRFVGSPAEKLAQTRLVRDAIRKKTADFIQSNS
jgi:arsenate reductase